MKSTNAWLGSRASGKHAMSSVARRPIRGTIAASRQLLRIAFRDPEHVPERLSLAAARRLGPAAREWAEATREARPDEPAATVAERVRAQSAQVARVDRAIAGTPFFIALVPGYLTYLQQE